MNGTTVHPLQAASGLVLAGRSQGTGYLVDHGRAATCAHVVEGVGEGGEVTITFQGYTRTAVVSALNQEHDCAILDLAKPLDNISPLSLGGSCSWKAPWDGYGFPKAGRGAGIPLEGVVMNPSARDDRNVPVLVLASQQVAAGMAVPVHGFSGSPVMVDGIVVGHLKRIIPDPDSDPQAPRPAFGLVYATPASAVAELLGVEPAVAIVLPADSRFALPSLREGEYHLLVSYRSTDEAWAKAVVTRLEGSGFRVFKEQRGLLSDERAAKARADAVERCRAALVLMSQAWLEAAACQDELQVLLQRTRQDPGFHVVGARIDDCARPAAWGAHAVIDFSTRSGPEGAELIHLQYALLNQPAPDIHARTSRVLRVESATTDDLARELRAAVGLGARRVFALWQQWQDAGMPTGAAALIAAESLVQVARPDLALRVLEAAAPGVRGEQLRALALSKVGKIDDALAILTRLRDAGEHDGETLAMLAGRQKQKWEASGATRFLEAAVRAYGEAFERTGDPYPGINAASLTLQAGRRAQSGELARAVLRALERVPPDEFDHWRLATRAEAYLLTGDFEKAKEWYEEAVARDPMAVENIGVMRRQARRNLEALGLQRDALDLVLAVPRVVTFSGHMVDAPGRPVPRFPTERIGAVRRALRDRIRELQIGYGFSSAAAGADLLFIEELLGCGGSVRVFLPFPSRQFVASSVGPTWSERFYRVYSHERVEVSELADQEVPGESAPATYSACTREAQRAAIAFAKRLDQEPLMLCVWNGQRGDGKGGTAEAVESWDEEGYPRVTIDITTLAT